MITFYPRDIELWRSTFDFGITLASAKPKSMRFYDTDELIGFLKSYGVRLDDPKIPLIIELHHGNGLHPTLGSGVYVVRQWTVLGWVQNDLRV